MSSTVVRRKVDGGVDDFQQSATGDAEEEGAQERFLVDGLRFLYWFEKRLVRLKKLIGNKHSVLEHSTPSSRYIVIWVFFSPFGRLIWKTAWGPHRKVLNVNP